MGNIGIEPFDKEIRQFTKLHGKEPEIFVLYPYHSVYSFTLPWSELNRQQREDFNTILLDPHITHFVLACEAPNAPT